MKKIQAERGLITSLADLYELIQDQTTENLADFMQAIVSSPGLCIKDGDEFYAILEGGKITIKLGGIVFGGEGYDYDVFLPDSVNNTMTIYLSEIENLGEGTFNIYVKLVTEETHPQRKSDGVFYTVNRNAVQIEIASENPSEPHFLLGYLEIDAENNRSITHCYYDNLLVLAQHYSSDEMIINSEDVDIEVNYLMSENFLPQYIESHDVNKESVLSNRRTSPIVEISWLTPTVGPAGVEHDIVYYKVVLVPLIGDPPSEAPKYAKSQIVMWEPVYDERVSRKRIGCTFNCDPGVEYIPKIFKIINPLKFSSINVSDSEISISSPDDINPKTPDFSVNHSFSSKFLRISPLDKYDRDIVMRVFVKEDSIPEKSTTYMIYEGAMQDVEYEVQDLTADNINVIVEYRNKYQNTTESSESFPQAISQTPEELCITYTFPEHWEHRWPADVNYIHVTNSNDGDVTPIQYPDGTTDDAYGPTGGLAYNICASPDGSRVYVASYAGSGEVYQFDTDDNSIIDSFTGGNLNQAHGVCCDLTGDYVYVASYSNHELVAIDTADMTQAWSINIGVHPHSVCVSSYYPAYGGSIYVTNDTDNTVSVIHFIGGVPTVTATIAVGTNPKGICAHGDLVFVANMFGHSVSIIDVTTDTVINTVSLGPGTAPHGIAVHPDGTYVYTADSGTDTMTIIDMSDLSTSTVAVGDTPYYVAVSNDGDYAYVSNDVDDTVTIINTDDTTTTTIDVGTNPRGICLVLSGYDPIETYDYITFDEDIWLTGVSSRNIGDTGSGFWAGAPGYAYFSTTELTAGNIGSEDWRRVWIGRSGVGELDCEDNPLHVEVGQSLYIQLQYSFLENNDSGFANQSGTTLYLRYKKEF